MHAQCAYMYHRLFQAGITASLHSGQAMLYLRLASLPEAAHTLALSVMHAHVIL